MEKKLLLDEYHQRNVRWTDKTLTQLSYFNNLMLILSVGFISFSYEILVTYEKRFLFNLIKLRYNDFIRVYSTNNIKRYKTYPEALIALDVVKKLGIINLKQGQYKFKIK